MNKQEILNKLFAKQRFGIKPGLERTLELARCFENPHDIKCVHIAGTNGKGSTASYIASIFTEAGYKTGLYTSPHIYDFNERIRINGVIINDDELVELASEVMEEADRIGATFFEITTIIAFAYFKKHNVDIAIIEAGMGGRFDSTNIIDPELSVIAKIDMDHKDYLGDTIEKIALEKAGIIKKNTPVIALFQSYNILNILKNKALELRANYTDTSAIEILNSSITPDLKLKLSLKAFGEEYTDIISPLPGAPQIQNISLALLAYLQIKDKYSLEPEHFYKGIANVKANTGIKYRFEIISTEPLIIADAAHNPDAMRCLRETLELIAPAIKWNIVFGGMKDKDLDSMLQAILPVCNKLVAVQANIPRSALVEDIVAIAAKFGKEAEAAASVDEAVDMLKSIGCPGVICGSFYVLAELSEPPLNKE